MRMTPAKRPPNVTPSTGKVPRLAGTRRFSTMVQIPEDLPYGSFTIEAAREGKVGPPPFASFAKAYSDDELLERKIGRAHV